MGQKTVLLNPSQIPQFWDKHSHTTPLPLPNGWKPCFFFFLGWGETLGGGGGASTESGHGGYLYTIGRGPTTRGWPFIYFLYVSFPPLLREGTCNHPRPVTIKSKKLMVLHGIHHVPQTKKKGGGESTNHSPEIGAAGALQGGKPELKALFFSIHRVQCQTVCLGPPPPEHRSVISMTTRWIWGVLALGTLRSQTISVDLRCLTTVLACGRFSWFWSKWQALNAGPNLRRFRATGDPKHIPLGLEAQSPPPPKKNNNKNSNLRK